MELTTRILLSFTQVTAFIAAILMWKRYKDTTQHYFIYFLGFVIFIDVLGYSFAKIYEVNNQFIYNFFTLVSGLFYLLWFKSILNKTRQIKFFIVLFLTAFLCGALFEGFRKLWQIPLITFAVLVLICSTIFYSNLLKTKDVIIFKTDQKFLIVTGVLIFYIGFLPLLLLQPYLKVSGITYRMCIFILNAIMYGFFTISFLCLQKK
jgi:hypothetical protein